MRPLGRAGGLITVWELMRGKERARLRRGGIWTPMIKDLGWGRVATLALMHEMAMQNATRTLGPRQHTRRRRGRGLNYHDQNEDYPTSGMGRARVRNPSPHSLPEPLFHLPYTWSQCLCRCILPAPPSPSSSESKTDSTSRPPSLESITDPEPPESGYEVSGIVSNSD